MNLVGLVSEALGLQRIGHIVFHGRQMLRAGVGHQTGLGWSTAGEDFVDWPVDGFAQNVPHADISRRSVIVGPRAAAARKLTRSLSGRTAQGRRHSDTSGASSGHSAGTSGRCGVITRRAFHARGRSHHRQQVDDALPDKNRLGPLQPSGGDATVTDGVVALDAAVGDDRDNLARL